MSKSRHLMVSALLISIVSLSTGAWGRNVADPERIIRDQSRTRMDSLGVNRALQPTMGIYSAGPSDIAKAAVAPRSAIRLASCNPDTWPCGGE